ncbi:MAG: tetratricopeptide repeat protein [Acidobacteria bacterium]|nr:tetratricopeptide repeat protein [Acidobacteriota bacterium]
MSNRLSSFVATLAILAPLALAQAPTTEHLDQKPTSEQLAKFLEARLAASEGDAAVALELFDELIRNEPEDPVLRLERAQVLSSIGRLRDAERDLEVAIRIDPAFADARKLYGRILLDRSNNDRSRVEKALEQLSIAWQTNPNDVSTGLTVAQILGGLGRGEQALAVLEGILERLPDNRTVNYQYAQALLQLDRGAEAIGALEIVVQQDPLYPPAAYQLVEIYQHEGRWSEAADLLTKLTELEPANQELATRRALALLRANRADEARAELEALSSENPEDLRLRFLFAEALSDVGEHQEAEKIYGDLVRLRGGDPDFMISYGFNQLRLGKLDSAERQFERVLSLRNLPPGVRNVAATQLASIALERGDEEDALRRARGAVSSEGSTNRQALAIALEVFRNRENWQEAIELIRSRMREEPDAVHLTARLLQFQILSGDERGAAKTANELVEHSADASLFPGQIYGELERWDDVVEAARRSVEKWGDTVSGLFQLASGLERAGKFDESVATFQRLLASYPDHSPSQNYLGYMWADKGVHLEEALALIQKAVDKYPRNGAYVDSLGWVHYRLGNLDLAERYMLDAVELVGDDPVVHHHLADVFSALGKLDRAVDSYQHALTLDPEDPAELRQKIERLREKIAARER